MQKLLAKVRFFGNSYKPMHNNISAYHLETAGISDFFLVQQITQ